MIPQHIFQIQLKLGKRTTYFANDILFFEAEVNYTRIHFVLDKSTSVIARTLSHVEGKVNTNTFIRINRKYLVNQKFIAKIGKTTALLTDGRTLPISRRKRGLIP